MSCPSTHSLSAPTYNNVCVLAASASSDVQTNFAQCCTAATSTVITNSCYQYCNVTDGAVAACFALGLQSMSPPVSVTSVDVNCINGAAVSGSGSSSDSPSSTAGSGSVTSAASSASSSASKAASSSASKSASSTGTGASTSASSSAPAASSSTTKASKASTAGSLSMGALAVVGLAVFGLLA